MKLLDVLNNVGDILDCIERYRVKVKALCDNSTNIDYYLIDVNSEAPQAEIWYYKKNNEINNYDVNYVRMYAHEEDLDSFDVFVIGLYGCRTDYLSEYHLDLISNNNVDNLGEVIWGYEN